MDQLYDRLIEPELFGSMVRHIMLEMQEHPQYEKQLVDDDRARLIEGLRSAMGEQRQRKQEKAKKTGTASRSPSRKSQVQNALAQTLARKLAALGGE